MSYALLLTKLFEQRIMKELCIQFIIMSGKHCIIIIVEYIAQNNDYCKLSWYFIILYYTSSHTINVLGKTPV